MLNCHEVTKIICYIMLSRLLPPPCSGSLCLHEWSFALKNWTMDDLHYRFRPLSITVVGCKLLSNEMAGVGAGDLVWSNRWRILYHFLHQSTRGFLWNISRALFAILWRILRNFCQFAAEKMR